MNKPFQNFKTPKSPKFEALGLIIFLVFSCTRTTPPGVPEDFSDLLYENEQLYILERNIQTITRYDLKLKKVTQRLNFNELPRIPMSKLYDTGKPFGLAEGLAMSKTLIYIGIDNNHYPLSQKASEFYNINGNPSSILQFKRPKGF